MPGDRSTHAETSTSLPFSSAAESVSAMSAASGAPYASASAKAASPPTPSSANLASENQSEDRPLLNGSAFLGPKGQPERISCTLANS